MSWVVNICVPIKLNSEIGGRLKKKTTINLTCLQNHTTPGTGA